MKSFCLVALLFSLNVSGQMRDSFPGVRIAGAMKDVMWRGELFGKISLDSLGGTGWYGSWPFGISARRVASGKWTTVCRHSIR